MKRNPVVVIIGGIGGVITAGLNMLLALGAFDLKGEQVAKIDGFVTVVVLLLLAAFAQTQTTPYDPITDNRPESMAILRLFEAQHKQDEAKFLAAAVAQQAHQVHRPLHAGD